jgi:hypothetical protein
LHAACHPKGGLAVLLVFRKWYFILFALIVVILLVVIERLEREVTWQSIDTVSDELSIALRNQLEKEKANALRFALVLSQNEALIEAMADDDEDKGYLILSDVMHKVEQYTHALVRSQIITKDYTIFARSWDNMYAGMPLDEYRPDLRYFLNHKEPRSAIEVGRRLGFKATVPIFKEGKSLGFVEVLQFFEPISSFFKSAGIDMYVLMEERFVNIAILMQENPYVGPYVVANRHYNAAYLADLNAIDFKKLQQQRVQRKGGHYFFFEPMFNGEGEKIGAFVFALSQQRLKTLAGREKDISFLINFSQRDLYAIVKKDQFESGLFQSSYDRELLYLKDIVPEEDRELFREEAFDRLSDYSKEELIGLLLSHKYAHEIKGEIR